MHRKLRFPASGLSSRAVLLAFLVSAPAMSARADVTIQEKTVTSGLGGFGSGTSERTLVVAGDKSRTDESYTYTGRFKTLAGSKPSATASIVRLDKELVWSLEPDKKQYSEMTFAEMREAMNKGMADAQTEMKKSENHKAQNVEMDFKVDVQRTGKRDVINGFKAENVILTLTATPKDKTSGEQGAGYKMTMDQWISTDTQGQSEMLAYHKKFAEKLGMDPQMQQMARGIMSQYGDGVKQLAEKMKDLKGYPVRSTMTMGMDMGLTPQQQAQMATAKSDAKKSEAEAKQQRATAEKREDVEVTVDAASSASHGNLKGGLGGFLSHKLSRVMEKKAENSMKSDSDEGGEAGFTFKATTDVVKMSTGPAAVSFDVPSDYKKVEHKQR